MHLKDKNHTLKKIEIFVKNFRYLEYIEISQRFSQAVSPGSQTVSQLAI